MKYLPVLIIVILLVVAAVVIQDVFRSKPIVNNQTPGLKQLAPSKINSTITAINSLKNNTALPQKAVRKTPNVPPIPLKK